MSVDSAVLEVVISLTSSDCDAIIVVVLTNVRIIRKKLNNCIEKDQSALPGNKEVKKVTISVRIGTPLTLQLR